ncbi:NFAT activation molecule 1 isoform X2 [Nannospalax galili]|nr:NFAT activation molecule 1 isoform X2 [Nannospalax galili]
MESRFPWCWALEGCLRPPGWLPVCWLFHLLLVPWTLQLAGGLSVTHTGLPIVVSLANIPASFSCRVNYQDISEHKGLTVTYFYVDLHGTHFYENSSAKLITCQPGAENQTLDCLVRPRLPDASATGTYYCSVHWRGSTVQGNGTFILVRDTGYQPPPLNPQKALLLGFTGLLSVLSVLGTALLLWKKKQMSVPGKQPTGTCPDPKPTNRPMKPPEESIYTALQHRETEVYACIESEAGSPASSQDPPSKEKLPHKPRFEDDSEFNLVYENL